MKGTDRTHRHIITRDYRAHLSLKQHHESTADFANATLSTWSCCHVVLKLSRRAMPGSCFDARLNTDTEERLHPLTRRLYLEQPVSAVRNRPRSQRPLSCQTVTVNQGSPQTQNGVCRVIPLRRSGTGHWRHLSSLQGTPRRHGRGPTYRLPDVVTQRKLSTVIIVPSFPQFDNFWSNFDVTNSSLTRPRTQIQTHA